MLRVLTFLEKPQTVSDWGHVMALDLSPWLWYQFFRAPNSQWAESRNLLLIAVPLKCLCCFCGKKKKKTGMQTVLEHWHCYCLLYWAMATTRTGSWGISTLRVLSAMFQPKMHLTGRCWQEVFALEEKCSPKGKGEEIKNSLCAGGIVKWEDFFPKGFLSF